MLQTCMCRHVERELSDSGVPSVAAVDAAHRIQAGPGDLLFLKGQGFPGLFGEHLLNPAAPAPTLLPVTLCCCCCCIQRIAAGTTAQLLLRCLINACSSAHVMSILLQLESREQSTSSSSCPCCLPVQVLVPCTSPQSCGGARPGCC